MKGSNIRLLAIGVVAVVLALSVSYPYMDDDDLEGKVYIIHTNDSHGYYDEYLGFASVAGLRDEYESRGATVFLLDAGDAFQGTATTLLTHGESTVDVMNTVGYDVMCPGNHEFDFTLDTYLGYTERLDFPTICSNLDWKDSGESVFPEYTILERDGIRLGVFGLLTPDTVGSVMAGFMDEVTVTDPTESAMEMVATLEAEGVDHIIALGHIGLSRTSEYCSDWICSEVDGIDVFIDGHSHTVMSGGQAIDGTVVVEETETVIASTGSYIQHVGVVDLTGERPIATLVDECDGDPHTQSVIDDIRNGQSEMLSQVIGETEVFLTGETIQSRLTETHMGDLAADSLRIYSGADVAVVNGGGIRMDIGIGEITREMVLNVNPFDNYVQTKIVTGQVLWDIMEISVGWMPEASGSFLQVSGFVVEYDPDAPSGQRVQSLTMDDGTPIDPDASYVLASYNFVMVNPDFPMLVDIPVEGTMDEMALDLLIRLISDIGTITEDYFDHQRIIPM